MNGLTYTKGTQLECTACTAEQTTLPPDYPGNAWLQGWTFVAVLAVIAVVAVRKRAKKRRMKLS